MAFEWLSTYKLQLEEQRHRRLTTLSSQLQSFAIHNGEEAEEGEVLLHPVPPPETGRVTVEEDEELIPPEKQRHWSTFDCTDCQRDVIKFWFDSFVKWRTAEREAFQERLFAGTDPDLAFIYTYWGPAHFQYHLFSS